MKYTIIKTDVKKDKDLILPILRRNLEGINEERYIWNYFKSPYGDSQCWLAREEDSGKYVGCGTLFPRRISIRGKLINAAIAGDFAVDKEHRVYGPALKLQQTIQLNINNCSKNSDLEFIYGIPNRLAKPIFSRIGYIELGKYNSFIKILKTEYKWKEYLPPAKLTRIFSKIIDLSLILFSKEKRYKRPSGISIEIPKRFDGRFDVLWARVHDQFNIIGERDSQFLNWRYKESKNNNKYEIFSIVNDKREILGYIVYYIKENICYISDLLSLNLDDFANVLLAEFSLYMRERAVGSISIRYFGDKSLLTLLKRFHFLLHKKGEAKVMAYIDKISPYATILHNDQNWYFLEGDTDL